MGYHLHGFTQVFTLPLLGDNVIVDAAGGNIIRLGGGDVEEAFVMTKIEVGFGSVIGHVALPMFVGVQGSGVYINIGIKLLDGYRKPPGLKEFTQGGRDNAFSQGGGNTSGYKNVFRRRHEWALKFRGQR